MAAHELVSGIEGELCSPTFSASPLCLFRDEASGGLSSSDSTGIASFLCHTMLQCASYSQFHSDPEIVFQRFCGCAADSDPLDHGFGRG